MATTPSTASTAPAEEQKAKKPGTISLSAGYRASVPFVLVPRTSITLDTPDFGVSLGFKIGLSLTHDFPIRGSSTNFPPGNRKCALSWQVSREGKHFSYPVDGEVLMKIQPGGRFEVEVNGKTPVIDLIAHQLIGKGKLGYSLTPDFPHAETTPLAPDMQVGFDNPCEIQVSLPEKKLLGERVTFTPHFAKVFQLAELELRVMETDAGSDEIAATEPRNAFTHTWTPGPFFRLSRSWAIGFTDNSCHQLADVGQEEAGAYEFAWQLWGRQGGGTPTLLLENKTFLTAPKPKLEDFRIEYDPSIEGTWEVSGKISEISPRAGLRLNVALVQPRSQTPLESHGTTAIQLSLGSDGIFEGYLGERHWFSEKPMAGEFPLAPAFAILSLPAAVRDDKLGPISAHLDFDDMTFSAFKGHELSWDVGADWVCSREALATEPRPPRPKRRKSGIVVIPAPPADAGNQKGPMTFEEMWNDLAAWEGIVPYMYLDKPGNVTVGAGNLLPSTKEARALPFQNKDAGRAATPEEISTAFQQVEQMKKGMWYTEYAQRPMIALTAQFIRDLVKKRLDTEFLPSIRETFKPHFDSYPLCVRRALLDIAYNRGPNSFNTKVPELTTAVKARNWTVAASLKCLDHGPEARAQWRKSLFQYASVVEPPKKA
jgi:GH24 family phage-related lysozyme (muramidase)